MNHLNGSSGWKNGPYREEQREEHHLGRMLRKDPHNMVVHWIWRKELRIYVNSKNLSERTGQQDKTMEAKKDVGFLVWRSGEGGEQNLQSELSNSRCGCGTEALRWPGPEMEIGVTVKATWEADISEKEQRE